MMNTVVQKKDVEKVQQDQHWWQSLKADVNQGYQGIIENVKNPFIGLSSYLQKDQNLDKSELNALRQKHFDLIALEAKKAQPDYNAITKIITRDTKEYLQKIFKEEEKKLGKPPCRFTVATLGSLAREETGPITDLEIAILPEKKNIETYKYFYKLTQNIADRLFLIGEHPDIGGKGLRMDEANNAPPHLRFFARNVTPEQANALLQEAIYNKQWDKIPYEGSRPFLATPEEFAEYSKPDFKQDKKVLHQKRKAAFEAEWDKALHDPKNKNKLKTQKGIKQLRSEIHFWIDQMYKPFNLRELKTADDAGKSLGRNIAPLYGDVALFNQFKKKRDQILEKHDPNGQKQKRKIAKEKMVSDIKDIYQKGKSVFLTGELGKTLDLKRELYRFVEQFFTNLGFYHDCQSQNSIEIARELMQRGILAPTFGQKMIEFMQFATGLKLKEQSILKRQGFAAYFDQEEFQKDKEDLEKQVINLKAGIEYLKKVDPKSSEVATKERELVKLEHKLEHLLDMAPGKIYSAQDVAKLKSMLPFAKDIFKEAVEWTQGKEKLGFDFKAPMSAVAPLTEKRPVILHQAPLETAKSKDISNKPHAKPVQAAIVNLRHFLKNRAKRH